MKLIQLLTIRAAAPLDSLSSGQVTELQTALTQLGYDVKGIDGIIGPNTRAAWALFKQHVGEDEPGSIGPGSVQLLQQKLDVGRIPSGPVWVNRFPNSTSLDDLQPPFRTSATNFLTSLRAAGVNVQVNSTLRPPQRAYLMHYAKAIADGDINASAVPSRPDVAIQWVHSTNAETVAAAQGMVDVYGIMGPVALDSMHIEGHAIDMFITWSGAPIVRDGKGNDVPLVGGPDPNNSSLIDVGNSHGVIRGIGIAGDPEHWSINGT